jgi:hypothetical protein
MRSLTVIPLSRSLFSLPLTMLPNAVELTPPFSAMQAPASFASATGVARRRRMLLKGIRVEITVNPFFSRKGKAEVAAPCHLSVHVMVVCCVLATTSVV